MAIRIQPPLDDTEKLLEQALPIVIRDRGRVAFLVPAGSSYNILARIRVMLSRRRQKMKKRGSKVKSFRLRSSVHPETHDGIRYECIILWQEVSESNMMIEALEDIMSHG